MTNQEKAKEYSEQRILAIPANVNEDMQVFYLDEDLGTADDVHYGLSGEIEMAFDNGYGTAMLKFREYLEKKKFEADKKMGDAYENGDLWDYYIAEQNKQLFNEIINELFKEE